MKKQEALPIVDRMYVTEIELDVQGDTFFPEFDEKQFRKVIDSENTEGIPFTYVTYIREGIPQALEEERSSYVKHSSE